MFKTFSMMFITNNIILFLLDLTFLQGASAYVHMMFVYKLLKETERKAMIKEMLKLMTPVWNHGYRTTTHTAER